MPAAVVVTAFAATGAAAVVGAAVAGAVGLGAVSALTATAIGVGIASGTMTAVQGGSASDVLKSAVIGGALSYAGGAIGEAVFGAESVAASDAVNKAIESGVSDSMINMAMTTSDPLAALNAAAGWTSSDPSYLMNIGYTGLVTDPISGRSVSVETAAKAQSMGWDAAGGSGVPDAAFVDANGTYFNAAGDVVQYGDFSGQIISSVPTTIDGISGVQVTDSVGNSWFEPAPGAMAPAPEPTFNPSTGPVSSGPVLAPDQTVVAGTAQGQQIPGAFSVDANGTYFDVNGNMVAQTSANGGVVGVDGIQYVEPTMAAPGAGNAEIGFGPVAPTPAPVPTTGIASVDQAAVQSYLNQGYTQAQIEAAIEANPNGGWGRSLMWGEMGPPGAVPPTIAPPANTIPVTLSDGSVGAFDPATGTVYNSAGGVDAGSTQTMQTAMGGGTSSPGTLLAEAAKDTAESGVVSDVPFRVEVSGAAGTADAPSYVTGPLSEGAQLATQTQVDAGAATWNPAANAWEVPAPAPVMPVPIPEVVTPQPYTPLTVGGRVLTPAEYAGAADALTVGGSSVGAGLGGIAATPTPTPGAEIGFGPVAPEVVAPPVTSTTPGLIETVTPGTGTNPVASVEVSPAPVVQPPSTGSTVGAGIGAGVTTPVSTLPPVVDAVPVPVTPGPIVPPPTVTPQYPTDVPTTPVNPANPNAPDNIDVGGGFNPAEVPVTDAVATPAPGGGLPGSVSSGGLSASDLALIAAGWTIVNGILTPPAPVKQGYGPLEPTKWGTMGALTNPGLNPGWIQARPMYETTSPVQSQYYWGNHPYTYEKADLANWNNVPYAPATPWGLQQPQAPFDVNTFIRQTMTPQQQAALAGSAPQYYGPIAPASPAGGNV